MSGQPVVPMVDAQGIHKFFGELHVLRGIDLRVERGEVCVLLGPSGSGKSTILRCINEMEQISAGRLYVNGELMGLREVTRNGKTELHRLPDAQIARQRSRIGMVFQRFNLFPHMTALENVMEAPRQVKKVSKPDAQKLAREQLAKVGLTDRADHYPSQLSGGQQQRVAIARALVTRPAVLFADEPTGALDSHSSHELLNYLRYTSQAFGQTIVMVTHDPNAAAYADRALMLSDGTVVDDLIAPTADTVLAAMKRLGS